MTITAISLSSCEKTDETHYSGEPRLVRVVTEYASGGHNVSDISYDKKGRITSLKGSNICGADGVCVIKYDDARHTATVKLNNNTEKTFELDELGRCVNDGEYSYTYSGDHLLCTDNATNPGNYIYHWNNDCLNGIGFEDGRPGGLFVYDNQDNPFYGLSYDPFCSLQHFTYDEFTFAMRLGFCAMSNRKLIKNYDGWEFSYSFSQDGKLREASITIFEEPFARVYASYEGEELRKPRDEGAENLPSYLEGDWIRTAYSDNGIESPTWFSTGWGFEYNGSMVSFDDENGVSLYRIQQGYIQILPTEVDGKIVDFSNGILSGVKSGPYVLEDMKQNISYKSGNLYEIQHSGQWDQHNKSQ